jgi:hypothetical protein
MERRVILMNNATMAQAENTQIKTKVLLALDSVSRIMAGGTP